MRRATFFGTAWLLLAAILAGCGSNKAAGQNAAAIEETGAYERYAAGAAYSGTVYDAAEEELDDSENGSSSSTADLETQKILSQEKLVYTCRLTLQTLEYDDTLAQLRSQIKSFEGIVEEEEESDSDYYWYDAARSSGGRRTLSMKVRIPTESYEDFLEALNGDGKITSKSSYVENISKQYHDTEAVIANLEKQEERLQEMMEQAKTIKDMITIEERLTEVQTRLDQSRSSLSEMDTDVRYSTIYLTLEEVRRYTEEPTPAETFGDRLKNALDGSAELFTGFLEGLLFFLIYALPIAAVLLIILLIVLRATRGWRSRSGERREARQRRRAEKREAKLRRKAERRAAKQPPDEK